MLLKVFILILSVKMFLYLPYLRENSVPERMPNVLSQLNGNRFDTLVEVTEDEETDEEDNLIQESSFTDSFGNDAISLLEADDEVVITELNELNTVVHL